MRKLFALSIVLLLLSCLKKKGLPENVLPPETMQLVFWDFMRADAFTKEFIRVDSTHTDSLENIKLQNRIFNFYKITREDFYRSYDYYTDHPELMNTVMDSIINRQNRNKSQFRLKAQ